MMIMLIMKKFLMQNLKKLKVKNKNYLFINQKTIEMLAEKAFLKYLII